MKKLKMIFALARNDFRAKYAGSFLGVLWAFVYPCITVVLYWFVFRVALHSEAEGGTPYLLWLVAALVPYLFMCDALPGAAGVFLDYSYLVKKVRFDIKLLPAVRVTSNFFIHAFFVFLLLVIAFAFGYFPSFGSLWLVYYMAAELAFLLSLGTLLSVLTVFIRDIRGVLGVVVQIGYWITPLFWSISALDPKLSLIIKIVNPVTYITEGFRGAAVFGAAPDIGYTIYFWCLTAVLGFAAVWFTKRLSCIISDYV